MQYRILCLKPAFSCILNKTTTPSWLLPLPDISYDIADRPKKSTPDLIYRQKCTRHKGKYQGYIALFTDGFKCDGGVDAATVCGNIVRTASLPNIASIFSAELHAICLAVNIIREVTQDKYVMYTDSMSSHPVVKKIQYDCLGLLESGKEASFCWIPSHVGIQGNDAVDKFAKITSERPQNIYLFTILIGTLFSEPRSTS